MEQLTTQDYEVAMETMAFAMRYLKKLKESGEGKFTNEEIQEKILKYDTLKHKLQAILKDSPKN
ncbi:MAG: hypothetical protein CMN93_05420 [Synechococcus sp. CPC35]|nr:hypothetical protein [Synechococcus sp. CPC35]